MVLLDEVIKAEREVESLKRKCARGLRKERQSRRQSLRAVASAIGISAPAIVNIEKGRSWETQTVKKLARFYSRDSQKQSAA